MKVNGRYRVLFIVLTAVMLSGCSVGTKETPGQSSEITKESAEIFAMNTIMDLTVYAEHPSDILAAAKAEIYKYENLFSVNVESSDVAKLNGAGGQPVTVSPETYGLLRESVELSARTGGLFDISVFPVVRAWGFTTEQYRIPSEDERAELVKEVDCTKIQLLENNMVSMPEQMQIDLGGIAKGYLSQRLVELFRERGVTAAVISLGGNVQTFGRKPDGKPFTVGVTDPSNDSDMIGTVEVEEKAVITSGSYQRFFERDGVRYHHIMDTRTGAPAQSDLKSVTVVSDRGELADSLATALFVMGKEKAIAFDRENEDVQCILVDDQNDVWVSDGIQWKEN